MTFFTPTGSGAQANKTVGLYWGLRLAKPGDIPGCTGAQAWPGASLQSDVREVPAVFGATMLGGGGSMQINPSGVISGTISGVKFSDVNGSGTQDAGEPGLPNWTINLCADSACEDKSYRRPPRARPDAYSFSVTPGAYWVHEVQQSGWTQTAPASGSFGGLTVHLGRRPHRNRSELWKPAARRRWSLRSP